MTGISQQQGKHGCLFTPLGFGPEQGLQSRHFACLIHGMHLVPALPRLGCGTVEVAGVEEGFSLWEYAALSNGLRTQSQKFTFNNKLLSSATGAGRWASI